MFLPWMIAVHGFSYGGAEHRDTAEEIIFHILHANASKFNMAQEDIVFFTPIQVLAFLFSMGSYSEHAALIRRKDDAAASSEGNERDA